MAHLIDKDALVAETEGLKSAAETMLSGKTDLPYWEAQKHLCEIFLSFINTLEVKEVDLDEYLDMELSHYGLSRTEISRVTLTASAVERIIRNAFELGLKARQE